MAIKGGLHLALHWINLNVTLETDCAEAVDLIKDNTPNSLVYAFEVNVTHELLREEKLE
jgi:hypothetical protein